MACPAQAWLAALPLVAMAAVTAAVVYKLHKAVSAATKRVLGKAERTHGAASGSFDLLQQAAAVLTLLTFVQAAASVTAMDLRWPYEVQWISALLQKVAELDIVGASAPECLAGAQLAPHVRWLISLFTPLALMLALKCIVCVSVARKDSAVVGVFLISYTSIAAAAASPFDCEGGVVRDRPGVVCEAGSGWEKQTTWTAIGAVALALCALVIVGVAQILRGAHASGALRNDEGTLRAFGGLYLRYSEECYFWEVVILVRKLLLTLVAKLLSGWAQIASCAVLFAGSLALQLRCTPFDSHALNRLEADALAACFALVGLGSWSLAGAPPAAVVALFVIVLAAVVVGAWAPLKSVWKGNAHAARAESSCVSDNPMVGDNVEGTHIQANSLGSATDDAAVL